MSIWFVKAIVKFTIIVKITVDIFFDYRNIYSSTPTKRMWRGAASKPPVTMCISHMLVRFSSRLRISEKEEILLSALFGSRPQCTARYSRSGRWYQVPTIKESRLSPIVSGPPVIASYTHSDTFPSPQSLHGSARPSCPKARPGRNAAAITATRKARYQGVCHHWHHAKRLSSSVTSTDIFTWLRFNSDMPLPDGQSGHSLVYQSTVGYFLGWLLSSKQRIRLSIQALVKIRHALHHNGNTCGALNIDAAIWKITAAYRLVKHRNRRSS